MIEISERSAPKGTGLYADAPSESFDRYGIPCLDLGCSASIHTEVMPGKTFFRHEYGGRVSMIEVRPEELADGSLDIWEMIAVPFLLRVHEAPA